MNRGVESRLDAALRRGVQNRRGDAAPPADGDNTEASTANDAAYDDSSTESKLETVILDEAPAGDRDVVDANIKRCCCHVRDCPQRLERERIDNSRFLNCNAIIVYLNVILGLAAG